MSFANFKKGVDTVIRAVLIVLLLTMCMVVFWQVFSRYILGKSARWSEETARYLMVWITFIGAAAGIANKSHLGFTLLTKRIKNETLHKLVLAFAYVAIIFFSYFLVKQGYEYAVEGAKQRWMSIPIKMSWVYGVIPVGGILLIFNSVCEIIRIFRPDVFFEEEVISDDE